MIVPHKADAKPVMVEKKGTKFEIKNATPTKKQVIAVHEARDTGKWHHNILCDSVRIAARCGPVGRRRRRKL